MIAHPPLPSAGASDDFLDDFEARCNGFRQTFQAYLAGQVELGDITRALSEATADAEMEFSRCSTGMSIDQLQRFATLQKAFDSMMESIFSEELKRNRQICANALENGEYFLVGLTHKSMQSAIYMMHSKDRINTEKQRKLDALEKEQVNIQSMLKVIKALQQVFEAEMDLMTLSRIEKGLALYVKAFNDIERSSLISACDRRVLQLVKAHFSKLLESSSGPITYEHLGRCYKPLTELPRHEALEPLISDCRRLANKEIGQAA